MLMVAAASAGLTVFAADGVFSALPMCGKVSGTAEVLVPGSKAWQAAEEHKYYPLGSAYRTVGEGSRIELHLGEKSKVIGSGDSSFRTVFRPIGDKVRMLTFESGTVELDLPRNLPEGVFVMTSKGFTVKDPAGESRFIGRKTGDGDLTTVRCVTGTMALSGLHFEIPAMHAADEMDVRTSHDLLYTGLNCTSGDFMIKLDQGMVPEIKNIETGEMGETGKTLEWKMSPKCAVRIHRSVPAVGARMSVAVMTFDSAGEMSNFRSFAEGRCEVNSGELVVKPVKNADDKESSSGASAEDVVEGTVSGAEDSGDGSGGESDDAGGDDSEDGEDDGDSGSDEE